MAVIKSLFGKSAEGKEISLYTLSNDQGMKAEITDLGATLVRVLVPDATGKADDLVLGLTMVRAITATTAFLAR